MTDSSPSPSAARATRAAWLSLLAVALVVRLAAGVWWERRLGETPFGFGDSDSYWHLAGDLARGEPYAYGSRFRVFRAPGYPLLLAPLYWLADPPPIWTARVLNALLGVAAVALTVLVSRRLRTLSFSRHDPNALTDRSLSSWPWLAGWLAALYPGAIAMSVFVLSEAPFCPCLLAQLYCQLRLLPAPSGDASQSPEAPRAWGWALAAGAAGGLATLIRPSWLLFTPALGALELIRHRGRGAGWRNTMLLAAGMCVVMAPWWWRNYRVTGHFVPTTLQLGASLRDGWGPGATGASDMRFLEPAYTALLEQERQGRLEPADFEYRLNQQLRDEAVQWAASHPAEAARLAWVKLRRTWNLWPNDAQFRSSRMKLLIAAGYVPLLLLVMGGLWRLRSAPGAWLLLLPALYLTSLHMIFVGSIRYRQPALLALTPVAGLAAAALWSSIRRAAGAREADR